MKNIFALIISAFILSHCAHTSSRAPSSVPANRQTLIGKGTRITLKQPIPFMNTISKKQTITVQSRKSFVSEGVKYSCLLSANVGNRDTYFLSEGTVLEYKDTSTNGVNTSFQPKKGTAVSLSCVNLNTGLAKKNLTLEEAQTAFPSDVLIIENSTPRFTAN